MRFREIEKIIKKTDGICIVSAVRIININIL